MAGGYRRLCGSRPDHVAEHTDALDLELDHVSRLQPAAVAELEDAAGADRPRTEDVPGQQACVPRRVAADRLPGVVHVGNGAPRALLAVDARDHRPGRAVELVRRDDDGTEARREVLALGRPEADLHLGTLDVTRRPVVH